MAEKDYIERDAAIEAFDDPSVERYYGDVDPDSVICVINSIPAADVRPVVLCRDCLHYEMGVCLKIYDDGAANKDAWQERNPDDFCSRGEDRNAPINCGADMRQS